MLSALFAFGFTFVLPDCAFLEACIREVVMTCRVSGNGDCHLSARPQSEPEDSALTVIVPGDTLTEEDYRDAIRALHRRCVSDPSLIASPLPSALVNTEAFVVTLETLWERVCAVDDSPAPSVALGTINDSLCVVGGPETFAFLPLVESGAWPRALLVDRPPQDIVDLVRLNKSGQTVRLYLNDTALHIAGYAIPAQAISRVKE